VGLRQYFSTYKWAYVMWAKIIGEPLEINDDMEWIGDVSGDPSETGHGIMPGDSDRCLCGRWEGHLHSVNFGDDDD